MAEYRIVVVVDPSRAKQGAGQVEGQLNRVGKAADRTRQLISNAFLFAGVAAGIHQLVRLSDTFTNMQNRLGTVTKGTAELAVVTQELLKVAKETRSSYRGTAEMFARVSLASRELGVSHKQLIQFTKSLNQAIILSGASAREANAGLIQLSQGMASGTLRGDELRSVLEQMPVVADVIAKSLERTRGELRLLGEAGKINAGVILKAFDESTDELDKRFAKTIPTIGQALEMLNTNFVELIGYSNQSTGAATTLSRSLIFLGENLEVVARIAAVAGIALAVDFAARGVGTAIRAVGSLTIALATNPIGMMARASVLAGAALVAFSDRITLSKDSLTNMQDVGQAAFEALKDGIKSLTEYMDKNFGFIGMGLHLLFGDVDVSMEGTLRLVARIIDLIVGTFKGAAAAIVIAFENIPAALELIFVNAFNAISRSYADFLNGIIYGVNKLGEKVGMEAIGGLTAFELKASEKASNIGLRMDAALAKGILSEGAAAAALEGILTRADEIAAERIKKQEEIAASEARVKALLDAISNEEVIPEDVKFVEILRLLEREGDLLRVNIRERKILQGILRAEKTMKRELTSSERSLIEAQLRTNQVLRDRAKILDEIQGPQIEYNANMKALVQLLDEGAISVEAFTNKQRKLLIDVLSHAKDAESGIRRAMLRLSDEVGDSASLVEDTLVGAFQKAEDALAEFVATGKTDFKSLIDSIMLDLTKLAIRDAITGPLARMMGMDAGQGGPGQGMSGVNGIGSLISGIGGLFSGRGAAESNPYFVGPPSSAAPGGSGMGSMMGWASMAMSLFGLDNGGDISIGGAGGIDKNILSVNNKPVARVSRGETISVKPNGSNQRPNQVNMYITTPDADSFGRSQDAILSRANRRLSRSSQRNKR